VLIKGGNHKLAVGLDPPYAPESRALVNADVQEFVRVRGRRPFRRSHPFRRPRPFPPVELAAPRPPWLGAQLLAEACVQEAMGDGCSTTCRISSSRPNVILRTLLTQSRRCDEMRQHSRGTPARVLLRTPCPFTPVGPVLAAPLQVYTREHPSTSSSRVRYLELDSVEEWVPEAAPVAVVGTPGGGGEGPRGDVQARGKEKGSSAAGLGGGKGGRGGGSEESEQARRRARSRDS
jgi:hypothetical protein